MAPFEGNNSTFVGSRNEKLVKDALPKFVETHINDLPLHGRPNIGILAPMRIIQIIDYGLLLCKDFHVLGFSPDGVCLVHQQDGDRTLEFLALLEIKTKTCKGTRNGSWRVILVDSCVLTCHGKKVELFFKLMMLLLCLFTF